jgi:hypothetical protein
MMLAGWPRIRPGTRAWREAVTVCHRPCASAPPGLVIISAYRPRTCDQHQPARLVVIMPAQLSNDERRSHVMGLLGAGRTLSTHAGIAIPVSPATS